MKCNFNFSKLPLNIVEVFIIFDLSQSQVMIPPLRMTRSHKAVLKCLRMQSGNNLSGPGKDEFHFTLRSTEIIMIYAVL